MATMLPVNYPPVASYMSHATVFSIISTTDRYVPWLISNYLQLRSNNDGIDYYNFVWPSFDCSWLNVQNLYRETLSALEVPIRKFLIYALHEGHYVFMFVY